MLALLEVAQVGKTFLKGAERDVVHAARRLFAVARDEGDGVPLVYELDRRLDVGLLQLELLGKLCNKVHSTPRPFRLQKALKNSIASTHRLDAKGPSGFLWAQSFLPQVA